MTYLIAFLNVTALLMLAVWIWRKQNPAIKTLFWPALSYKLLAGIGLGLIYLHYYSSGDTFTLFDQANEQARLFHRGPSAYFDFLFSDADTEFKGAARSLFFVKIISTIALLTDGNYWITSLCCSFLSFIASFYFVEVLVRTFPGVKSAAALAFLFFPSVIFWGSGVIKESFALAGILVLAALFLQGMKNKVPRAGEWLAGLVSVVVVWNLKYYWIAVFLPVGITSLIIYLGFRHRVVSPWLKVGGWWLLFIVLTLSASLTHPNFYPDRFLQVIVESNRAFTAVSAPEDLVHYDDLEATWQSVLINTPTALVAGLFRPFIWEADTILKALVAMENLLILLFSVVQLWRIRQWGQTRERLILLSAAAYILLLCTSLALSTPNLGSLARYRVGFLPFLLALLSYRNPVIRYIASLPGLGFLKKWTD